MNPQPKETALVIGNGPSVDLLPASILPAFTTFGANHIGRLFPKWGVELDHVLVTDSKRIPELKGLYADYKGRLHIGNEHYAHPPQAKIERMLGRKIEPLRQLARTRLRYVPGGRAICWPERLAGLVFDKSRFSFDPESGFNFGQSVTFSAIQLAVALGFKRILLTGVDSYYQKGEYFAAAQGSIKYINKTFTANPRFFMEPLLVLLQVQLEELGCELIDCTPGGHLRFIPKGEFTQEAPYYRRVEHRL